MRFLKNFIDWFQLKPQINTNKKRPMFQEREVWMCHLGANIGFEIDGKKSEHLRPVIVFKKLSKETFLAIPISSGSKTGSWYSPSSVHGRAGRFCLNQIRMIDAKRLKYWIERIDDNDFLKLKSDFFNLLNS
jgi:mRNA-degrading endonuclease toxin of MazEF toxin-antitoxin module